MFVSIQAAPLEQFFKFDLLIQDITYKNVRISYFQILRTTVLGGSHLVSTLSSVDNGKEA